MGGVEAGEGEVDADVGLHNESDGLPHAEVRKGYLSLAMPLSGCCADLDVRGCDVPAFPDKTEGS